MISLRFSTLVFLALGLAVSAAPQGLLDLSESPLSGDVDGGAGANLDPAPRDYAEKYGREGELHEQFVDYSDEKLGVPDITDARHEHGYRPRSYAEQYGHVDEYDHEHPVEYSYESMHGAGELQTRRSVKREADDGIAKRQDASDYGYNNEGYYGGFEYKSDCHGRYRRVYFSEEHDIECDHILESV